MQLPLLDRNSLEFPPSSAALAEPNGLLAFGGDLSTERLLVAYSRGIFPWYSAGEPILWWSPDPRTVFLPGDVHCSRSLQKFMRHCEWQVSIDVCFDKVIESCASIRRKSAGTWITRDMLAAYRRLHRAGYAHSVEVWENEVLIGGIYGVALGGAFFGESMFSAKTNASKVALLRFSRFLFNHDFAIFDAQVANNHLFSMGARNMTRAEFEAILARSCQLERVQNKQLTWHTAKKKLLSNDGYILDQALRHS